MEGRTSNLAVCLLARSGLGGALLFMLPPFGEFPPSWQIQLAFAAWVGWCYWHGLLGRTRLPLVVIESAVSLWLSLKWARLFVLAGSLAPELIVKVTTP
ncbi:MAG TPA: hypothetical protein VHY35_06525 [Stellaceae bacterium]|jgi:hypothetical protein|nr:hypothetical protein [Stellaceae bacterium]